MTVTCVERVRPTTINLGKHAKSVVLYKPAAEAWKVLPMAWEIVPE